MKKTVSTLITLLFFICCVQAQYPPPCGTATARPPGCLLCSPLYNGNSGGFGSLGPQGHPCGGFFENSQIIGVVADANGVISATILPTNCQNGDGLEIFIIDPSIRPFGAQNLLDCFSPPGGVVIPGSVMAGGLIPGNPYGILIDGEDGDICDFSVAVTGAAWSVPPTPPGPIRQVPAEKRLCVGAEVCYEIDPPNANEILELEWTIPSNSRKTSGGGPDDTEVCIAITRNGGGVVKVTGSNPCHSSAPAIFPIVTTVIPPSVKPPINVCGQDLPIMIDGFTFFDIGINEAIYKTVEGCDSIVNYILVPVQQNPAIIDTTICPGDTITIGPDKYWELGQHDLRFSNAPYNQANGCDSIISLLVRVLEPEAVIQPPSRVSCAPGSTTTVDGSSSTTGDNVSYSWTAINGRGIVDGQDSSILTVNWPGSYILTVTETNDAGTVSCIDKDTAVVQVDPIPLSTPIFINPVLEVCPNTTTNYDIAFVWDATDYLWVDLNGDSITGIDRTIPITVGNTGGDLCVEAVGPCGNSAQICVTITVNATPTADFTVDSPVCMDVETSTIQYTGNASATANYTWNFNGGTPASVTGPGPHNISWNSPGMKTISLEVDANGCGGAQSTQMVQVDAPLADPVISCDPDLNSVTFTWDPVIGAIDYSISINSNPPTTQIGTTLTVPGLNPGDNVDITVTANGMSACGTSSTSTNCVAQDCLPVTISIDQVAPICLMANAATIQLVANQSNGAGGGTFTWSGPGTNTSGVFDPNGANIGANVISVQYQEANCSYTGSTTIIVNNVPTADFTVDSPICEDDFSNVTYIGSASSNAMFDWDFGSGTVLSGVPGPGPFQVQWPSGNATVSLTVTENGCTSPENSIPIQIDAPLPDPVISCLSTTTTSVTFTWDAVPGATTYVVNGPGNTITDLTARTATIDGLSAGDQITIEVVAMGNNQCGDSRASFTCTASNCVAVPIDIDPIGPFCDDGNNTPVMLSATAGDNSGTFTWTGPGVSGNMFDPDAAAVNPGVITIRVTYEKDNCTDSEVLQVTVNERPFADFTVESPICIEDASNIEFSGNAAGLTFNWDFDGGRPANATTVGPHQVSWTTTGIKNISLTVDENGCASVPNSISVQVDDELPKPEIMCTTDQSSITFTWPLVPGALSYEVNLLNGFVGTYDGVRTYEVTGLVPDDLTEIEVIATGTTACGSSIDTLECIAQACPEYIINLPQIDPFCLYPSVAAFELDTFSDFSITDLDGNDILNDVYLEWTDGSGGNVYVTPGGRFSPNQAAQQAGFGTRRFAAIVEYPSGSGCITTHVDSLVINSLPLNTLFMESQICENESATVALGSLVNDPGATLDWDFGRATAVPGTGEGPHTLTWASGGIRDSVTLVITSSAGCVSDVMKSRIQIDEELNATDLNLRCNLNTTNNQTIEFNWDVVPGITNYDFNVLTPGFTPTNTTPTSVVFGGLTPGTMIELELEISNADSSCPPVTTSVECSAVECENPTLTFVPIADNCLDPNGGNSYQLEIQITPDPSNGAGTRTWSGGSHISSTGMFMPTSQGDYPIEFELEFEGCFYRNSTTITMIETPVAAFSIDPIICQTEVANLNFTGAAHPDAVFNWDFDGGNISGTNRDPQTVSWPNETGEQTISLNIENSGCSDGPVTQMVQVDPVLEPIVIICDPSQATPTQVGFDWNDDPNVDEYEILIEYPIGSGNVNQGTQTNSDFIFRDVIVGDSMVQITVIPISNTTCPKDAVSFTCESADCPDLRLNIDLRTPVCSADPAFPISANVIGGTGMEVISISGSGVSNGEFDPAIAGIGMHTITFEFSVDGCDYSETRDIEVKGAPRVEAGDNQTISCDELSVEIGSDDTPGGLSYQWTLDGVVVGNARKIDASAGGNYILQVSDNTGCTNIDSVFVDASFSDPEIIADLGQISCFGDDDGSIELIGLEGSMPPFEFSVNGSAFSDRTLLENLGPGEYTIVGRGSNGCADTLTFTIEEPDDLAVEIQITSGQNPVPFADSVELTASTDASLFDLSAITWSPADQLPACDETNINNCVSLWVSPQGETIYTVRIENMAGCAATDEISITGLVEHWVYVPTAFSPRNNDQVNDVFGIYGNPDYVSSVKSFLVFDRWGETIFENYNFPAATSQTIDPANGWDGTYRGVLLNSGVYTYFAEIEFFDGHIEIVKGEVTMK